MGWEKIKEYTNGPGFYNSVKHPYYCYEYLYSDPDRPKVGIILERYVDGYGYVSYKILKYNGLSLDEADQLVSQFRKEHFQNDYKNVDYERMRSDERAQAKYDRERAEREAEELKRWQEKQNKKAQIEKKVKDIFGKDD